MIQQSLEPLLPQKDEHGRDLGREQKQRRKLSLQLICTGSAEALDGEYIRSLVHCSDAERPKELDRYVKLLRSNFSVDATATVKAQTYTQTLTGTSTAIEARGIIQQGILKFVRELHDACAILSTPTVVEPPIWLVRVAGHKKGSELSRRAEKKKDYYTIQLTHGGQETSSEPPKYTVHRRWSELKEFFEGTELKKIAHASGAHVQAALLAAAPKPPQEPWNRWSSTADDRLALLQDYFAKWNTWNEALRQTHGISITEISGVWDFFEYSQI